jgi:hypothetical protein
MDERTCAKCKALDNQTWAFPKLEGVLIDSQFGPIYDLTADQPLTHPNCRCFLEVRPLIELEKTDVYQETQEVLARFGYMPSNIQDATRDVDKLRVNIAQARGELREMEYILFRTTSMLNKMGLPPDIQKDIQIFERTIMVIRMLHSTWIYFELGTPIGLILGLIGLASFGLSAGSLIVDAERLR